MVRGGELEESLRMLSHFDQTTRDIEYYKRAKCDNLPTNLKVAWVGFIDDLMGD